MNGEVITAIEDQDIILPYIAFTEKTSVITFFF